MSSVNATKSTGNTGFDNGLYDIFLCNVPNANRCSDLLVTTSYIGSCNFSTIMYLRLNSLMAI